MDSHTSDFYTSIHKKLHERKNLQATLCGAVTIAGFVGFMAIPSQVKKIDHIKLGLITTSLLSAPIGLVILDSKKDLDSKAQLLAYAEDNKLGEQVGADISIEQEKVRTRTAQRLAEILQSGGNP